jgi:hypothetical protein
MNIKNDESFLCCTFKLRNPIVKEWSQKPHGFMAIEQTQLDTMLFVDDLVLLATSDDFSELLTT